MNIKLRLREALLKEIGDSEGLPFEIVDSTINKRHISLTYEFTVPKENDESYTIEVSNSSYVNNETSEEIRNKLGIERLENGIYLYVDFKLKGTYGKYEVINKGDVFKILTTVKSIVLDTIKICEEKGFELVMIYSLPVSNSSKGSNSSNIRKNMYDYLYKKFKRPNFELFQVGMYSGIYDKTKSDNQLNDEPKQEPIDNTSQLETDTIIDKINEVLSKPGRQLNKTIEPSIDDNDITFNDIKLSYFFRDGNVYFYPMDEKSLNFIIQNESRLVNLVD